MRFQDRPSNNISHTSYILNDGSLVGTSKIPSCSAEYDITSTPRKTIVKLVTYSANIGEIDYYKKEL